MSMGPPHFFIQQFTHSEDFNKIEYLLEIYIGTGGDPNCEFEDGHPLLEVLLIYVYTQMDAHLANSDLEDEDTHGCDSSSEDENSL